MVVDHAFQQLYLIYFPYTAALTFLNLGIHVERQKVSTPPTSISSRLDAY